MAGFEVITYGRFWVIAKESGADRFWSSLGFEPPMTSSVSICI
jgi:hypothetical protein